jgi:hypothetical protein
LSIRIRGFLLALLGGTIFSLIAYWISHPSSYPFSHFPAGPGGALLIGIPGAVAVIGMVECVSGRALRELELTWASLNGLKRFFLGSLLVIVGGAIAFTIIGLLVA